MSETKFPPTDPRPEHEIFCELETLCSQPGYIHVIAYLCYRDNLIKYRGNKITEDDLGNLFSYDSLLRTEISTLIGLMAKQSIDLTIPKAAELQKHITKTEELLLELHGALNVPMMDHMRNAIKNGDKGDPFDNADVMREPIFYGGESAYSFQYSQLAQLKYHNDNDWLTQNKQFNIDEASKIALAIAVLQPDKLMECISAFAKDTSENRTVLPGFAFTKTELITASGLPEVTVQGFLDAFSCDLDAGNSTFTSLNEFNETNAAPILKVSETEFVLLQQYSLQEAIYESPFFWMGLDDDYKSTAFENRGNFAEQFIFGRLVSIFGSDRVCSNVDIYKGKDRYAEVDILVLFGDHAIVVQAKSKRLTIEARKGNDLQLKKDFEQAIQNAADQGFRCAEALTNDGFRFVLSDGRDLNLEAKPRIVYPVCAVSDHYPALASQARQFLEFKSTKHIQPPLTVDVFTIDVMTEMLDTPLHFLNYLALRKESGDKLVVSHELTILGYHLKQNLWLDDKYDMVNIGDDFTASLDIAMMARRFDAPGEKTPKGILTRFIGTNIGRLLDDIGKDGSPNLTGLGLLFMQLSSDAARDINNGFDQIIRSVRRDGALHDFSVPFESSKNGFTVHCSRLPLIQAQEKLLAHCKLRKYATKSDAWYGIAIDPDSGRIAGALLNEDEWKHDLQMELALQEWTPEPAKSLSALRQRPKKVGRNDGCPCGSGKKYKKCCLERYTS